NHLQPYIDKDQEAYLSINLNSITGYRTLITIEFLLVLEFYKRFYLLKAKHLMECCKRKGTMHTNNKSSLNSLLVLNFQLFEKIQLKKAI
ncbi:MAG: hypothetical protein EBT45_08205, partial [Alphaproteobacteria bacterium]|nr:hypothetical protein [Alphaproteobacteria bacterium]